MDLHGLNQRLQKSPFSSFLGLQVIEFDLEEKTIEMSCDMRPEFERAAGTGQWHGGVLSAVIDTVGDYALIMLVQRPVPTINFRVDYLRPAVANRLISRAVVRRSGRSIGTVDIEVFAQSSQLVAVGRATYSLLPT